MNGGLDSLVVDFGAVDGFEFLEEYADLATIWRTKCVEKEWFGGYAPYRGRERTPCYSTQAIETVLHTSTAPNLGNVWGVFAVSD